MASSVTYHLGGYVPAAPAQNRAELYDGTAGTFTSWDAAGNVTASRALTGPESTQLAAQDAATLAGANMATVQANITTRLNQIESYLAANPNGSILTAAQTAILARMLAGLGRVVLNLTSTIGQAT